METWMSFWSLNSKYTEPLILAILLLTFWLLELTLTEFDSYKMHLVKYSIVSIAGDLQWFETANHLSGCKNDCEIQNSKDKTYSFEHLIWLLWAEP